MNSLTLSYDSQARQPSPNKTQRKRGKINIVACDRCKRDKKRCDGNYLTQKACKYCRNHDEVCVYSETNVLRICRILSAAAKNAAAEEREGDPEKPIQELEEQLTKYENIIVTLSNQLENKNEIEQSNTMEPIEKLYLSLFANPQISNDQTIILKKLCEMTSNPVNSNIDGENIDKIRNSLLIIASDDRADAEKGHAWEELEKFVKMCNDNVSYPSDNLPASNIFGISGSTTPIPSPQFINAKVHVTNNHVTAIRRNSKKFENNYEPYPSGGRIDIRPSRKETNMMVLQDNLRGEIPMIAVHAPQNHSIRSTNSNGTFQDPNVQLDNTPSNENFQIPTSSLLLSSHIYGLDDVGQFSNITSPTFSRNSISDDNLEFPSIFSPVENWLGIFPNSL